MWNCIGSKGLGEKKKVAYRLKEPFFRNGIVFFEPVFGFAEKL